MNLNFQAICWYFAWYFSQSCLSAPFDLSHPEIESTRWCCVIRVHIRLISSSINSLNDQEIRKLVERYCCCAILRRLLLLSEPERRQRQLLARIFSHPVHPQPLQFTEDIRNILRSRVHRSRDEFSVSELIFNKRIFVLRITSLSRFRFFFSLSFRVRFCFCSFSFMNHRIAQNRFQRERRKTEKIASRA